MVEIDRKKTVRIFFALWPNAAELEVMATWQPLLHKLCGGKAMSTETLHNTLVFVGNVAEHRLEALQLTAQEVVGERFDLQFEQARYWGHNHIVYAAPAIIPLQLMQLVEGLEQHLRRHRFQFDQRKYKPHVTLLRHAKWHDAVLPEMPHCIWRIHEFVLVQSLSDANGARYQVIARFPLGRKK